MRLNNKFGFTLICSTFLLLLFSGCKKFVEIPAPKNQLVTATVFRDSANATAALLGIYSSINSSTGGFIFLNGGTTVWAGLSADEIVTNSGDPYEMEFYTNAVSPVNNGYNGSIWQDAYKIIYQANACIEGITASEFISPSAKNQLVGEAKFFRALCYFYLVNFYGDVPLVINTDYKKNAVLPRVSTDSIYSQIIHDLSNAKNLLSISYVTGGRTRVNKYAAIALLSRVYLYLQKWTEAESNASEIIESNVYSLETDLNKVFLAGSDEAIFQMSPVQPGYETAEGYSFVPNDPTVIPNITISNYLMNSFEANDHRKQKWISSSNINGKFYYYPYKYKLGNDGNSTPVENYMVLRLAEQYLIRAEAEAWGAGGGLTGALTDLNMIRNRAGLFNYSGMIDKDSILAAILHEREVELFCEWGHRWFDLKRTGEADIIMPAVTQNKGGIWNSNWKLYPIPFFEIQNNPFLEQNAGY